MIKPNEQIRIINLAITQISGLYSKWAQKKEVSFDRLNIMYMLDSVGPITQKQFSEAFNVPKQSVNKAVSTLKNDGIVSLKTNEKDKREKTIFLTEKGKKYAVELLHPLYEIENMVLARMGESLMAQLVETTTTFTDYLELEMKKSEAKNPITKFTHD